MVALLREGERFGSLEVLSLIGQDEDGEPRYRARCLRCRTTCCTVREDALLCGRAKLCFDCTQLARMGDREKRLIAFRRSLQMSPSPLLDWLTVETISQEMTIAQALSEAA